MFVSMNSQKMTVSKYLGVNSWQQILFVSYFIDKKSLPAIRYNTS